MTLNEMTTTLWPLIMGLTYQWFILLVVFLFCLILTGTKLIKWMRNRNNQQVSEDKKTIIKDAVIYLVVVPIVIAIILAISSGIIVSIIKKTVDGWKETGGDVSAPLTSTGNWKDIQYYIDNGTHNSDGLNFMGIKLALPIRLSPDGTNIENFDYIKSMLSGFIKG